MSNQATSAKHEGCECGCEEQPNANRRFVLGHNVRLRDTGTFEARFWSKVRKTDGCWLWTASLRPSGYGQVKGPDGKLTNAHRAAYLLAKGPIAPGLELDHLCHSADHGCLGGSACLHRRCVNPDHLEPVTHAENAHRGVRPRRTHCPQGHPYSPDNTRRNKNGSRSCRTCGIQNAREARQR